MKFDLDQNKTELFIKTFLWNILIDFFKDKKNKQIEEYLVSISVRGNIIFIKTNNPTFASEVLLFENDIFSILEKKLSKPGINIENFKLKTIF